MGTDSLISSGIIVGLFDIFILIRRKVLRRNLPLVTLFMDQMRFRCHCGSIPFLHLLHQYLSIVE